jgi:hypothetical protein
LLYAEPALLETHGGWGAGSRSGHPPGLWRRGKRGEAKQELGKPCRRGTVGLLQGRPVTAGEIKLIGKESNRIEDRFTGLLTIDELDERLTVYHDNDGWRRFTLPKLQTMGSREVAETVGISERQARDVLKGRAMPHPRHRAAMEARDQLG